MPAVPPALDALLSRRSVSSRLLSDPAPSADEVRLMVAAGLRAPDHGRLRPWRFIGIEQAARARLGETLADAFLARHPDATPEQLARERGKPLRAPLLLAVGAVIDPAHPTVRVIDQQLAAGAAAMNVMNAVHFLGYGAIWLTGESCHDPVVKLALGLRQQDFIAGWLYIGSIQGVPSDPVRSEPEAALTSWAPEA